MKHLLAIAAGSLCLLLSAGAARAAAPVFSPGALQALKAQIEQKHQTALAKKQAIAPVLQACQGMIAFDQGISRLGEQFQHELAHVTQMGKQPQQVSPGSLQQAQRNSQDSLARFQQQLQMMNNLLQQMNNATMQVIKGQVGKGPFLRDSEVAVIPLSASGAPGEALRTRTADDLGSFAIAFPRAGGVMVEGRGRFYDEAAGRLSEKPLRLRAIHDLERGSALNVNAFTHLASQRILALIARGRRIGEAIAQAERELAAALPFPGSGPGQAGADMVVTRNAYLLTLSAIITRAGADASGPDGGVQGVLDRLALDLAEDGRLEPGNVALLRRAKERIEGGAVKRGFEAYLRKLGAGVDLPALMP